MAPYDRGVAWGSERKQSGRREQCFRSKTPEFLTAAHVSKALFSFSRIFYVCLGLT